MEIVHIIVNCNDTAYRPCAGYEGSGERHEWGLIFFSKNRQSLFTDLSAEARASTGIRK